MIIIENLYKTYQKFTKSPAKIALDGINLHIKKGSFFGLLGPNGAGKSTIINILAGLVKKTSGKVVVAGFDIDTHFCQSKYKIGIVPQELIIDPFFNVYETLEIYAGYFGVPKNQRRTTQIIQALGLTDKAKSAPRALSGGMRRRLLVAKALVHNPDILVLDEPTAGVDVELRNQLWEYVQELNQQGTTVLLTTHYLSEAEQLCNEIAVINKGRVVAYDSKHNLLNSLSEKQLIIHVKQSIVENQVLLPKLKCNINNQNEIVINYNPNHISITDILLQIKEAKLDILDISTKQPDLEQVFQHIIHKNE
jgi:ABC-2 type transport system ATP-binding protein